MSASLTAFLYLVSGVLFILALRGLSHPETSRQGNLFGMVGMALAILTTLFGIRRRIFGWRCSSWRWAGGAVGATIARRIPMTAMPQLVAAFHSLVGLAAVLVAAAALYAPQAFGIGAIGDIHAAGAGRDVARRRHRRDHLHRLDHRLPKLDGSMSGKPILLPARHVINIVLGGPDRRLHRTVSR